MSLSAHRQTKKNAFFICLKHLTINKKVQSFQCGELLKDMILGRHLFKAVQQGYVALAILLLRGGIPTDYYEKGNNPLLEATCQGCLQLVSMLLKAGAHLHRNQQISNMCLRESSRRGFEEISIELIRHGAYVNTRNRAGEFPLLLAASSGHTNIVRLLLNAGADVNLKSNASETALHLASEKGHVDVVQLLLNSNNIVDLNSLCQRSIFCSYSAIELAIENEHSEIVAKLIQAGSIIKSTSASRIADCIEGNENQKFSPLQMASKKGNVKIVKMLLAAGAAVNEGRIDGFYDRRVAGLGGFYSYGALTALMQAISEGKAEVVAILIQAGANLDIKDFHSNTPLHVAASKGYADIVKILHSFPSFQFLLNSKNYEGNTPLHLAALHGREECFFLLLKYGAQVDVKNCDDETPLVVSAQKGRDSFVSALFKAGVKAGTSETKGAASIAISIAISSGYADIVHMFIENGAFLETRDKAGNTFLMQAAAAGRENVVQVLLEAGATVDSQNIAGETALMVAAEQGHRTVVQMLLKAGANVQLKNNQDKTALELIFGSGRKFIAHLLSSAEQELGAK